MIKVIDSIMGSGKSTYAIQYINNNPDKRYIFISPLLSEVQRVKDNCANFDEPEEYTEYGEKCLKLDSFHKLLKQGINIASTHALFKLTTEETIKYLQKWNYVLFIDEVLQVVETDSINATDLDDLLKCGYANVDPTTRYLQWLDDSYTGESFRKIMIMSKTKSIFVMGEGKKKQTLIWVFPALIFNYFSEVWVMTYLFDCQPLRYYFAMNNLEFIKYRIDGGQLVSNDNHVDDKSNIKINFYDGKKNDIGNEGKTGLQKQTCLCSTWYNKATEEQFKRLQKNIYGYFNNDLKSPSELNLWTCFKGDKDKYRLKLQGNGYTKGFLACNARATNDYRHKLSIAYVINVFMNPIILNFFDANGIKITREEQENYALSEMLQWLWRSALREGQEVSLYIPSVRMRRILKQWLGIPKL